MGLGLEAPILCFPTLLARSPLSWGRAFFAASDGFPGRQWWYAPAIDRFTGGHQSMSNIVRIGVIILCVAALYWLVIQLGEGFAG